MYYCATCQKQPSLGDVRSAADVDWTAPILLASFMGLMFLGLWWGTRN